MTTIDRCREFYNSDVAPMIHGCFPEYEGRIVGGLAGEGSECFGYDDEISRDHDFGISVCLWLTDEDFVSIGSELDEAYRELIKRVHGTHDGTRLEQRRGVQRITDFYRNLIGFDFDMNTPHMTDAQWFITDDWRLAAAVNGEIFRDDLGAFSEVRQMLETHYPDRVFRMKLVNALHGYAGAWQANYPRCMVRGDYVAAGQCISRGIEAAMQIVFLLKKRYMPYYKWSYRALQELADTDPEVSLIADLISETAMSGSQEAAWKSIDYDPRIINDSDELVKISEKIAEIIVEMLADRDLAENKETFLEAHCDYIAAGIQR